ncbi:acetamidase/formamidase [Massilia violacea]|uniref:Acetamidase/formamidase n=2 Tax=Pseudoduganella violacea TaxID=1715466 RepID=A0A7W5BEP4_9BURK|nr:acetamidase/formamidase [Pseudoduganella violacea]
MRFPITLLCFFITSLANATATDAWVVKIERWGNPTYQSMHLEQNGMDLAGTLGGDPLVGRRDGDQIAFTVTDSSSNRYVYRGTLDGAVLRGSSDHPDTNVPHRRAQHAFSARRLPQRVSTAPQRHVFLPTNYSNVFSAERDPVLTIWPGDSVRTSTIDSGGVDEQGVTRALYGNPQTGPFFVVGAEPGDTLVVHLRRLRLNRDYADSLDDIVGRARATSMADKAGALGKPVRWHLDRERGLASPEHAGGNLAGFAVPLRPMLGGLALAPADGPPLSTGDTGRAGGNMDFNEVVEGNSVYLPVQQPGALLYLGDAHAAQGDGETSQWALETSMEVEFAVHLIKGKAINMPRVESPTHIMVLGQAGSLDEALRAATGGMVQWLAQDYGLSLPESALVLGSVVKYSVANLAGRSVGMAAKIDKAVLSRLQRLHSQPPSAP